MRSPRETLSIPLIAPAPLGSSAWLLHLRWFAVTGQLATILAAAVLTTVPLPYLTLLVLVALTAFTNIIYGAALPGIKSAATDPSERVYTDRPFVEREFDDHQSSVLHSVALALMLLDLVTLSAMLHISGGTGNPFSFFYFVNLAVGGVMIRPKAAWSLTATAIAGYTFLLFFSKPIEGFGSIAQPQFDLKTTGLMLAFSTCATVVTYFVTRTAGELQRRERQLLHAQAQQAASHRQESLTTLAAGAAHELATPLSTIDVIVRELSRHLEGCDKPLSVDKDLHLIDGQLEMCRQILHRMRSAAGESMSQRWDRTTIGNLIDATLEGVRDPHRVEVADGSDAVEATSLWVPQEAVAQAVRNLIHNGLDASGESGMVQLEPRLSLEAVELRVIDSGQGMTDEVLGRASEPFFTTKEPGKGIGLGLFLTRNVISQLGGDLRFRSKPGFGTEVIVRIPLENPNQDQQAINR